MVDSSWVLQGFTTTTCLSSLEVTGFPSQQQVTAERCLLNSMLFVIRLAIPVSWNQYWTGNLKCNQDPKHSELVIKIVFKAFRCVKTVIKSVNFALHQSLFYLLVLWQISLKLNFELLHKYFNPDKSVLMDFASNLFK